ncbi:hypothetical protein CMV_014953 [Castanea mollissima]|uniref:Uncharacterized protein n=1 Tax=Castanea mollissima TaxID=60419 RepID=A0A8J4R5Z4_9ROSI|nr:hypothetical protein CMV_014953 [Castanea mollissima]
MLIFEMDKITYLGLVIDSLGKSYEVMLITTTPLCKRNHKTPVLITKSFNNLDIVLFSKRIGLMNMEKATSWTTVPNLSPSLLVDHKHLHALKSNPSSEGTKVVDKVEPYIDFKISEGKFERIRELYEKLLDKLKHLKGATN